MAHHWRVDAWWNHDGAAGDLLGAVLYGALDMEFTDMKTIIEMAGKAFETPGVEPAFRNGFWTVTSEELERFAALVRADEREACAKVCDAFQARDVGMQPAECAGAIRARGNT
jgi:hypothetical protein